MKRGGGHEVSFLAEEHFVIAAWGELIFFKYVAFGSLTKLQWMVIYSRVYGNRKLNSIG